MIVPITVVIKTLKRTLKHSGIGRIRDTCLCMCACCTCVRVMYQQPIKRESILYSENTFYTPSFHRHVRISRMCNNLCVCVCVCVYVCAQVQIPVGVNAGEEITATGADFFEEEA